MRARKENFGGHSLVDMIAGGDYLGADLTGRMVEPLKSWLSCPTTPEISLPFLSSHVGQKGRY